MGAAGRGALLLGWMGTGGLSGIDKPEVIAASTTDIVAHAQRFFRWRGVGRGGRVTRAVRGVAGRVPQWAAGARRCGLSRRLRCALAAAARALVSAPGGKCFGTCRPASVAHELHVGLACRSPCSRACLYQGRAFPVSRARVELLIRETRLDVDVQVELRHSQVPARGIACCRAGWSIRLSSRSARRRSRARASCRRVRARCRRCAHRARPECLRSA